MTEQPASPSPRPSEEFDRRDADGQRPAADSAPAAPGTDDRVVDTAADPPARAEESSAGAPEAFAVAPGAGGASGATTSDGSDGVGGPGGSDGSDAPGDATTGVPEVDALLGVLDDLDVLPIEDHAQVFSEAHQRLHRTLLSADEE